jgi:hypothetical protein
MGTMLFVRDVYTNVYKWTEMFKTGWTSVTYTECMQCPLMSASNEKLEDVKSHGSQGQKSHYHRNYKKLNICHRPEHLTALGSTRFVED